MKYKCDYRAAIILGMHDAIVSLTGMIAGLFFAFTDKNIIIISCIISSISASLSMSAANYLAVKSSNKEIALMSAFCTGLAYMITCGLLLLPFIFSERIFILSGVIIVAIGIILGFNLFCYKGKFFYKHFFEMLSICTSVSLVSFFIGEMTKQIF